MREIESILSRKLYKVENLTSERKQQAKRTKILQLDTRYF